MAADLTAKYLALRNFLKREEFDKALSACEELPAVEYARGPDPFKWPEEMRDAALHDRAYGFDDSAAYARIRAAMVPEGRETTETFLTHRGRRSSPPSAATSGQTRKRR